MRSPLPASLTVIGHKPFKRAAKLVVNPGGMCWVMTIAGESAGICTSTSLIASVPPVEAPMQISFSVDRRPRSAEAGGATAAPAPPPAGAASRTGARRTWATAATRILSTICAARSLRPLASPTRGLATKSTAPSSSAFMVTSAPRSVSVEIITTGIGRKRIRRPRKSMPSIRGISTSSVMTSGLSSRIISRATKGSLAVPMHSMSRCRLMISDSRLRTSAESSTTITRIFLLINSRLPRDGEKNHLARINIQYILGDDGNPLRVQVVQNKIGVALTDVHGREVVHDLRPAKYLGLHGLAPGAQLEHLVDQQFHRVRTIAARRIRHVTIGQHEMVHPSHMRAAVPQAGGNTRPQHGHDDHVLVTDEILTRKYLHSVVLEMMVQVEKGCFPRLSAARFEILQR